MGCRVRVRVASLLLAFLFLQNSCSVSHAATDDYESLRACLSKFTAEDERTIAAILYAPFINNASYTEVLRSLIRNRRFNSSTIPKPTIIITPTKESHVSAAVTCTRALGKQLKIRSGGHDYDGLSYISDVPFFMLDLFNFRSIVVNVEIETAWVESRAMLGELYYRIGRRGRSTAFLLGVWGVSYCWSHGTSQRRRVWESVEEVRPVSGPHHQCQDC